MMNKLARTHFLRLLASACFAGVTLCCSLVSGQQLLPKQQKAEQNSSQENKPLTSIRIALKPLAPMSAETQAIPLKPLKTTAAAEAAPVVKKAVAAGSAPNSTKITVAPTGPEPVVMPKVTEMPVAVVVPETSLAKGKNFPADAEKRIAEFLKANNQPTATAQSAEASAPRVANNKNSIPTVPVTQPATVQPATAQPATVQPATAETQQALGARTPFVNITATPNTAPIASQSSDVLTPVASIGGVGSISNTSPMPNPMASPQEMILTAPGEEDFFDAENAYIEDPTTEVLVDYGAQAATFDCCGFITSSRYYAVYDTLNFQRNDGIFRASNITTLDDFGFNFGARATIGKKRDATRGYEGTFMGFDPWIATSTQTNAAGTLVGALYPLRTNNLPPNAYSAFQNGTYAQQWNKTRLYSLAFNRTWWGSDVVKAFVGGRYIQFQDDFRLSMANINGEQGFHSIQGRNQMFGVHTGMEVLYDIGYRLSFSYAWKLGGYANAARNTVTHINNGQLRGFGGIEKTDFAWSAEFGVWSRYKITPNVRFRAGYEMFSLFNVYDSESLYSPRFGNTMPNLQNQGDAIFHGPSFGFEIYR